MRKITFDEEELLAIAVLDPDTRQNTIRQLEDILPELQDDPDMEVIVSSEEEKLKLISEEAFAELDLESYRNEFLEDDEEGAAE